MTNKIKLTDLAFENLINEFLLSHFRFRQVELLSYFQPVCVLYDYDNASGEDLLDFIDSPNYFKILRSTAKNHWLLYTKDTLPKIIWEEFRFRNLEWKINVSDRKKFIGIASSIIENNLIKNIPIPLEAKAAIEKGRIKIKKIDLNNKERNITKDGILPEVNKLYYYCDSSNSPYFANPAFVIEKINNVAHEIIYFTNADNRYTSTNKTNINAWCFKAVSAKELGITPLDAVLNRER
jgi:hypothetical protein